LRGEVESYTHGKTNTDGQPDPTKSGSVLTYGPYDTQQPTTAFEEVKVHYEFTAPIPFVEQLERDIEVSHWGNNLAIEERYVLVNHAARSLPFYLPY